MNNYNKIDLEDVEIGLEINLVTKLPQATKRNYLSRMTDNKAEAMIVENQFGQDYWFGDRRYAYRVIVSFQGDGNWS